VTAIKKIEVSKEAKQLAAMLLDVLAGARTPPEAAAALGVSLPRYYQLEDRGVNGLLLACETRSRGRQANAETQLHTLTKENERVKRELGRYQALVRLTQRTVGVPPPPSASAKEKGKRRKRRPSVRAMHRAERLREEAPGEIGAKVPEPLGTE
jgi:transposase InsO family protein